MLFEEELRRGLFDGLLLFEEARRRVLIRAHLLHHFDQDSFLRFYAFSVCFCFVFYFRFVYSYFYYLFSFYE